MSTTFCPHPLIHVLGLGLDMGTAQGSYSGQLPEHRQFLDQVFNPGLPDLDTFEPEELQGFAALEAGLINDWLDSKGFSITLEPFTDPDDFGVASVATVAIEWQESGVTSNIEHEGDSYEGAFLAVAPVVTIADFPNPIGLLSTKDGVVYMTKWEGSQEKLELFRLGMQMLSGTMTPDHSYEGVIFPMVDHDAEVDVSFMVDLLFPGIGVTTGRMDTYRLKEAQQQTKFRMNEEGAKVESAAAASFCLECCFEPTPPLIIDGPFLVVIKNHKRQMPDFIGIITPEDWAHPGNL